MAVVLCDRSIGETCSAENSKNNEKEKNGHHQ